MKRLIRQSEITETEASLIADQVVDLLKEKGFKAVSIYERFGDNSEICEMLNSDGSTLNDELEQMFNIGEHYDEFTVSIAKNWFDDDENNFVLSVDVI